ncbi:MAG: pseudouridine synthase [Nostocaceae cyanobacterium]|nr:pseudouridine synthase [Nostocaceae cyanobacterium]
MEERLQKLLSQWGVASRRQAEEMIRQGRVCLNGNVANLGQKADPQTDQITVDGKPLYPNNRPKLVYLLLNKPDGVVSTCYDPQGRTTVVDLLSKELRKHQGIHPVGRLDVDSTGVLLLTNDGELTFKLTHPRHSIPKTYHVWIQGHPPKAVLQVWQNGVVLDGRKTLPAQVRVIDQGAEDTCLEVILREGRNRQIRRVAEQLGYPVKKLHRTAIGAIQLQLPGEPPLPKGYYRHLNDVEVHFLQNEINHTPVKETAAIKEHSR